MYIDILLDKFCVTHKPEYTVTIEQHTYRYDFYLPDYDIYIDNMRLEKVTAGE